MFAQTDINLKSHIDWRPIPPKNVFSMQTDQLPVMSQYTQSDPVAEDKPVMKPAETFIEQELLGYYESTNFTQTDEKSYQS